MRGLRRDKGGMVFVGGASRLRDHDRQLAPQITAGQVETRRPSSYVNTSLFQISLFSAIHS